MTTITIDRAVVEQALDFVVATNKSSQFWLVPESNLNKTVTALRAALAQQAEPVEPVAWKQGNLVTFNEDPYPALGGLFVQLWDGEEVAARVYANDLKTLRQRCAKVNTAPPQRKQAEPVEPVATLIAQRDALLEALNDIANTDPVDAALDPQRAVRIARAAIKAVEEGK